MVTWESKNENDKHFKNNFTETEIKWAHVKLNKHYKINDPQIFTSFEAYELSKLSDLKDQ